MVGSGGSDGGGQGFLKKLAEKKIEEFLEVLGVDCLEDITELTN